ncbi:Oidioi.mRNA.OKI2018_I69.XSR.g16988.t1.cds [Oikopleura dioica]|uniref:Oidioi.mRNA.OKI2018_I69.XSR.g16988.t1.cds n=1 Tax=Oikopleura dioica TaxID=34765 RepID=A0ABN7SJM4_OIKDI|nr:Oidioi.mRNA.OKI2018_I69.XSR.g16988.t1.cds [Oikopleura dioica]
MTHLFKRQLIMLTVSELALATSLEDICKDVYCTKCFELVSIFRRPIPACQKLLSLKNCCSLILNGADGLVTVRASSCVDLSTAKIKVGSQDELGASSGISEDDLSNVISQKIDLFNPDQVEVCELKQTIEPGLLLLLFGASIIGMITIYSIYLLKFGNYKKRKDYEQPLLNSPKK